MCWSINHLGRLIMRRLFIFFFTILVLSSGCLAQFNRVEIGVNGLTCSQCSRGVETERRKLDFVRDVQLDLQHTRGRLL